jgi:hypothetical protein
LQVQLERGDDQGQIGSAQTQTGQWHFGLKQITLQQAIVISASILGTTREISPLSGIVI